MTVRKPPVLTIDQPTRLAPLWRRRFFLPVVLTLVCTVAGISLLAMRVSVAQTPPSGGGYSGGGYDNPYAGGGYEEAGYGYGGGEYGGYGADPYGGEMGGGSAGSMMSGPDPRHELNARVAPLVSRLGKAEGKEQQKEIRSELSKILEDYFDRDLEQRQAGIESIEQRVEQLRAKCEQRKQAKEEIVQLQLNVLENQAAGLGFFGQALSRGMGSEMGMGGDMGEMSGYSGGGFGGPGGISDLPGAGPGAMSSMYGSGTGPGMGGPRNPIPKAFLKQATVDFVEAPFGEVLDYLRDCSGANIHVDRQQLKQVSVTTDQPVTMNVKDASVATVLDLATASLSAYLGVRYEDDVAIIGLRTEPTLAEQHPWGGDGSPRSRETDVRLSGTGDYAFRDTPLTDALDFIRDATESDIFLNVHSLHGIGLSEESPISIRLTNVKHRTALRLILDSVDKSLYFSVVDGVVVVASSRAIARGQQRIDSEASGDHSTAPGGMPDGMPGMDVQPTEEQLTGSPVDVAVGGYARSLPPTSGAEEVTILEAGLRASEAKFKLVEAAYEQGQVGALDLQEAQSAFEIATQQLAKVKREYTAKERLLELELQQAQLELDAAKSTLSEHMKVNESSPGTVPTATVKQAELSVQTAELSVKRMQTLLDLHRKPVPDPSP